MSEVRMQEVLSEALLDALIEVELESQLSFDRVAHTLFQKLLESPRVPAHQDQGSAEGMVLLSTTRVQ